MCIKAYPYPYPYPWSRQTRQPVNYGSGPSQGVSAGRLRPDSTHWCQSRSMLPLLLLHHPLSLILQLNAASQHGRLHRTGSADNPHGRAVHGCHLRLQLGDPSRWMTGPGDACTYRGRVRSAVRPGRVLCRFPEPPACRGLHAQNGQWWWYTHGLTCLVRGSGAVETRLKTPDMHAAKRLHTCKYE